VGYPSLIKQPGEQMATAETLKAIVENGSNLVLLKSVRAELLYELAEIASCTGANLTVPTTLRAAIANDLAARYGKTMTFMHGINELKKD